MWIIVRNSTLLSSKSKMKNKNYQKYINTKITDGVYLGNDSFIKDIPKLEKLITLNLETFELDEKRLSPSVHLPLYYTRKVAKDKDAEKTIVNLKLYKNIYCLLKNLHTYMGPPLSDNICRNCLSTFSIDTELKSHQKFC